MTSLKDASRLNWGPEDKDPDHKFSYEELRLGALLRMADSFEALVKDRTEMEKDRDMYKKLWKEAEEKMKDYRDKWRGQKSLAGRLRLQIAELKDQLAESNVLSS